MSAAPTPPPRRRARGFTLLEIMATVAIVGLASAYILTAREGAANHAFRSYHMMEAIRLAEYELAEWALSPDVVEAQQGSFQLDGEVVGQGVYSYELTVEEFDLSTGRPVEEDDEDGDGIPDDQAGVASNFGDASGPADGGLGDALSEDEEDPYVVRRVVMRVFYPNPLDEEPEEIVLERFLPAVVEPEEDDDR